MRIVFIGDIYGRSGRDAVKKHLPDLKEKYKPDIVIVNVDNASNGRGITEKHAAEMFEAGADCLTGGDHVWDQREMLPYITREPRMLRPLNYPESAPGNGVYECKAASGETCLIIHAAGRVFMKEVFNDPFAAIKHVLDRNPLGNRINAIFVDFHTEATSEKMAMGHYLDGKVSAVIGSHTHIPTADAHIMAGGTAYQTDTGMTGDYDSVIGARKEIPVQKFVKGIPGERMIPANGTATLCGCLVVTDDNTGLAKSIEPIRIDGVLQEAMPTN